MQLNRPIEILRMLEECLCDVGVWSWWGQQSDDSVEFEFTGVQLYFPPSEEAQPPGNQIGLRFTDPTLVAFLTRPHADVALDSDWPRAMSEDELGPFRIDLEEFTLTDANMLPELLQEAEEVTVQIGSDEIKLPTSGVALGFWAGPVGAVVVADNLELIGPEGPVAFDQIARLKEQWWDYWRSYWEARDAGEPLPEDYTCEATLPGGQ